MPRRLKRILFAGLAVAAILIAVAIGFRAPLLEAVLSTALRARGVANVALSVTDVGPTQTRISDVRLAFPDPPGATLVIDDVRLLYTPGDILNGRLGAVALDGLRLDLDLTDKTAETAPPAPFPFTWPGTGATSLRDLPALPPLTVTDARITAATQLGPVRIRGEGALHTSRETMAGRATFTFAGPGTLVHGTAEAEITADGGLAGSVQIARGSVEMNDLHLKGLTGDGAFSVRPGARPR